MSVLLVFTSANQVNDVLTSLEGISASVLEATDKQIKRVKVQS